VTLKKDEAPIESVTLDCACADCGHEQRDMDPCGRCRSVRVVLVTVIRELLGEDWRSAFAPETP
jgi:hypothetical protein